MCWKRSERRQRLAMPAILAASCAGWSHEPTTHFTPQLHRRRGRASADCMRLAMEMAEVSDDDIGYVNAHGTGTPLNDVAETNAYENCLSRTQTADSRLFDEILFPDALPGRGWSVGGNHHDYRGSLCLRAAPPTLRLTDPIESPSVNWLRWKGSLLWRLPRGNVGFRLGFGGSNTALIWERTVRERTLMTPECGSYYGHGFCESLWHARRTNSTVRVGARPYHRVANRRTAASIFGQAISSCQRGAGFENEAAGSLVGVGHGGFLTGYSGCRNRLEPGGPFPDCCRVRHQLRAMR